MRHVKELQASLQSEFSECDADDRPFVPHLSLGQVKKARGLAELHNDLDAAMKAFLLEDIDWSIEWPVGSVVVIERNGYSDPFRVVGEVTFPDLMSDSTTTLSE